MLRARGGGFEFNGLQAAPLFFLGSEGLHLTPWVPTERQILRQTHFGEQRTEKTRGPVRAPRFVLRRWHSLTTF